MTEFGAMKRSTSDVEDEEELGSTDAPQKRFRSGGGAGTAQGASGSQGGGVAGSAVSGGGTGGGTSSGQRVELRALIPSKNAGAIIGKGGSNISRLRSEFKASVTVPDCPGPERVLTVMSDVETVCDVLSDIIPKLEDLSSHSSSNYSSEVRMLVHQSHAGCIIGRAGFKIKELREQTGANIKVYTRCCPQSSERVVQISGKPSVVVDCIRQIFIILEHSPTKGPIDPYDPHNADSFCAEEYGGYLDPMGQPSGRMDGGRSGPPMGKPMGPHSMRGGFGMGEPGPGRMGRGGGGRGGFMGGHPARDMGPRAGGGGGGSMRMGRNLMGSGPNQMGRGPSQGRGGSMGHHGPGPNHMSGNFRDNSDFPQRPRGGPKGGMRPNDWRFGPDDMEDDMGGDGMMGGGGMNPFNNGRGGDQDFSGDNFGQVNRIGGRGGGNGSGGCTQVTIPKELAGSIIGRGGSRIRQIRQESGANITIDEALPGCNDRVITINGSPSQIEMAQYLLQQSVRDHSGRRF